MAVKSFNVMNLGKTGLFNPKQTGYQDSIDIIRDEFHKTRTSFVKIGWYLKHINDDLLYAEEGYANIYECARDKLNISQPTVTRLINLCIRFSVDNDSPELDEKYIDFNMSQLFEMLPMKEGEDQITPDMTVKQIREKKKEKRLVDEQKNDEIPGQTSLENDFSECMPEEQKEKEDGKGTEFYATSHNENISSFSAVDNIQKKCGTESECWEEGIEGDKNNDEIGNRNNNIIDGEYREINGSESKEETTGSEQQPELPVLKNNDQRKEWLANYKEWGLWYRDEHLDVNYYKYDFSDGSRLIVAEYPQRQNYWKKNKIEDEYYYHMLQVDKEGYEFTYHEKYRSSVDNETYLVDFLKKLQKKIRSD